MDAYRQYQQAVETLRDALDSIQENDEIAGIVAARDEVLHRYQPLFLPDSIKNLTPDAFQDFLGFKNNRHWTGLSRLGSAITGDMAALKQALLELLNEDVPVKDRLDSLVPNFRARVPKLNRAILTPILMISYPDRYGVWNNTARAGLRAVGLWPGFSRSDTMGDRYVKINEVLTRLRDDLGTDFWTLDALWWGLKGTQESDETESTAWIVRAEKFGEQEATAISKNVAVIGWNQLDDLSDIKSKSDVEARFRKADPGIEKHKLTNITTQVWQFVNDINDGDIVLLPLKTDPGQVMVGEITGDYQYEQLADNVKHTRPVEWLGRYPKANFPDELYSYLDVPKTVCRIAMNGAAPLITKHIDRAVRRESEEAAKEAIEQFYPDASARKPILEAFAGAIRYAHGISEKVYCVNLHYRRIRLVVGGPQVMKLEKNQVVVLVDDKILKDQTDDALTQYMDRSYDWKSVKNAVDFVIPYQEFGSVYPRIVEAHRAMIESASKTVSVPPSARAHSSGVLKYLRTELGETLPDPVHPEPIPHRKGQRSAGGITDRAFELLSILHENPVKEVYNEHKAEIRKHLINPFRVSFNAAASRIKEEISDVLETERNTFARITKNDYGQGNVWPFYWAAFYPKGSNKTKEPQMAVWMNHEMMQVGFFLNPVNRGKCDQFERNIKAHRTELEELLEDSLSSGDLWFRKWVGPKDAPMDGAVKEWRELFDRPIDHSNVFKVLERESVVGMDAEELSTTIVDIFENLYPLMILTMSDDPVPEIAAYLDIVSGPNGDPGDNPVYTLLECAEETGFNVSILEKWVTAINRKGQGVFYGPPGTGKTYIAERIAKHLIGGNDGYAELLQFHPAYAYEDFMQGLRPQKTDSGGFDYELVPGRFFEFCREARSRKGPCVLIIDEINRANLARVFGELMYLLEYRGKEVPLAMGKTFRIPPNVRLIGTMNTADRSIAVVDHALRRRFAFIPLHPNYDLLQDKLVDSDIDGSALTVVLKKLNTKIADPNYSIGISFFLAEDIDDHIESIWQMEIEPYLEEYFVDKPGVVDEFRWDRVSKDIGIEGE